MNERGSSGSPFIENILTSLHSRSGHALEPRRPPYYMGIMAALATAVRRLYLGKIYGEEGGVS